MALVGQLTGAPDDVRPWALIQLAEKLLSQAETQGTMVEGYCFALGEVNLTRIMKI